MSSNAVRCQLSGKKHRSTLQALKIATRKQRSAMSNGTTILAGIDGRSREARRFRDLVVTYAEPLGGVATLSDAHIVLVRQAAAVTIQAELIQTAAASGERVASTELMRVTNALTWVLRELRETKHFFPRLSLAERILREQKEARG